jgi:hypothetical protein
MPAPQAGSRLSGVDGLRSPVVIDPNSCLLYAAQRLDNLTAIGVGLKTLQITHYALHPVALDLVAASALRHTRYAPYLYYRIQTQKKVASKEATRLKGKKK